jgi:hypothetical protein
MNDDTKAPSEPTIIRPANKRKSLWKNSGTLIAVLTTDIPNTLKATSSTDLLVETTARNTGTAVTAK